MDRAIEPETLAAALDRAVAAVCDSIPVNLDEPAADRLLLDLTKLETDVDRFASTVEVLMKHLSAA